ncbi:MAG: putative transport system permease protein [Acidimicrobiaceae bacterium]|nr:putative transport system permease protein [Acidimicrobiaceae bacterium]
MSTALLERPTERRPPNGGGPARRAVVRWGWRLFLREWRQQLLVLALLTVAVAATTAGIAVATSASKAPKATFTVPGSDPQLDADIAAIEKAFGPVEVSAHKKVAIPGSVSTLDLRAKVGGGVGSSPTVRLLSGRLPAGPGEAALTHDVAAILDVGIGDTWHEDGQTLHIVGMVENPLDLLDEYALVAPGEADPPTTISMQLPTSAPDLRSFHLPSGSPLQVEVESAGTKTAAAVAVLALASIGLLFVGLVAVAGFTVMAQRRLRALGMLGSLGATDRHVRLVMLANGAAVGAFAAFVGTATGLAGWLAFAPRLETLAERRIDRFDLPWWAMGAAMALAIGTAVAASWWPARAAARIPVVAALSGRPPRPQPAHRFAALGGLLVALGLLLIFLAHQKRPLLVIAGVPASAIGVLLLAPLAIRALAAGARRCPIAIRLALRDLARYQARSGAALGAVTLAVGIAASMAVSASAEAAATPPTRGNLPADQLVVYLAAHGHGGPTPDLDPAQLQAVQASVTSMADALHARAVVALEVATNPTAAAVPGPGNGEGGKEPAALVRITARDGGVGVEFVTPLYVATPDLLARYGIKPGVLDPGADVLTSESGLSGLQLGYGPRQELAHPKIQKVNLPTYTSGPTALITTHTVDALGLQVVPSAWLIQTAGPLTRARVSAARKLAAGAGLTVEIRQSQRSLERLGDEATAAGTLLALAVLIMTVGLIRSETANDLRTLTATGASSTTRRTLTGATAGALALLGALLGTAGAYLVLVAWYRSRLHLLGHPPIFDLAVIIAGLPLVAVVGGSLLAGREPAAIARRPLE